MSRSRRGLWLLALTSLILALGLSQLRLEVSLFDLLPRDSPVVEGLRQYHENFGTSQELILSLRASDAAAAEHAVQALAKALEEAKLSPGVIWRDPIRSEPATFGELIAYLWFNESPERFTAMANQFGEAKLRPTLERTLERLQTSLDPGELTRISRDPYRLTEILGRLHHSSVADATSLFRSRDGHFRVLFLPAPEEASGFWRQRQWVGEVQDFITEWQQRAELGFPVIVRMTGKPAFVAEVGSELLRDLLLAALGTLALVGGLFWIVHRVWTPLIWLLMLLISVLAATTILGSMLFGSLHAASLGFAAILLGLAADYALILYHEYLAHPRRSLAQHRAALAGSIGWAAVTSAGAFLMLTRSSLPGLTQLGVLVAIGILVGATVMMTFFLIPVATRTPAAARVLGTQQSTRTPTGSVLIPALSTRSVWWITLLGATAIALLLFQQRPHVDYGTSALRPTSVQARAALEDIQAHTGEMDNALWLIVSGTDEAEVATRLKNVSTFLDAAVQAGHIAGYSLPDALWPQPEAQRANRRLARWLASQWRPARDAALNVGFTDESLQLTEQIFEAWQRFASHPNTVQPEHANAKWLFRRFAAQDADRALALGQVRVFADTADAELVQLADLINAKSGVRLVGWNLLSESLLDTIRRDVESVLVPMGIMLAILLGMAFRRLTEMALSLFTLGFTFLCLLGAMVILGWSWNLMNVMALALLLGAGVDYSIHIQLALRRYNGDLRRVRETVGKAILLCSASTAAAFGSLGWASNPGLAGLGKLSAVGIVIVSLVSVFLLPTWWQTANARWGKNFSIDQL